MRSVIADKRICGIARIQRVSSSTIFGQSPAQFDLESPEILAADLLPTPIRLMKSNHCYLNYLDSQDNVLAQLMKLAIELACSQGATILEDDWILAA